MEKLKYSKIVKFQFSHYEHFLKFEKDCTKKIFIDTNGLRIVLMKEKGGRITRTLKETTICRFRLDKYSNVSQLIKHYVLFTSI